MDDHEELRGKFSKVVFAEDQLNETLTEEQNTIKRRELELQTKKLMTVVKSKYYMLKVNFPKQAELIDNEPIIDETAGDTDSQAARESQYTNDSKKVNTRLKTNVKTMDQTTDSIDFGENSKEEKAKQIAKDREQLKSIS